MNEKCFCHIGMADGTRYKVKDADARESIETLNGSINNLYVNTINDLKSLTTLIDGNVIKTLGYYSVNDGGGALYKIRTKDSTDSENGIIHLLSNELVAEMIIEDDTINLKQVGFNSSNSAGVNTSIIYNMISLFRNGGKIIIPFGSYNIEPITIDFKINGLKMIGEIKRGVELKNNTTGLFTFNFTKAVYGLTLEDFRIECNGVSDGIRFEKDSEGTHGEININRVSVNKCRKGFKLHNVVYLNMRDSSVTLNEDVTTGDYCYEINGYEYNRFENCTGQINGSGNPYPNVDICRIIESSYLWFKNCEFVKTGGNGIYILSNNTRSGNIYIDTCTLYRVNTGVLLESNNKSSKNINITNCHITLDGVINSESCIKTLKSSGTEKIIGLNVDNLYAERFGSTTGILFNFGDNTIDSMHLLNISCLWASGSPNMQFGNNKPASLSFSKPYMDGESTITGDGSKTEFDIIFNAGSKPVISDKPPIIVFNPLSEGIRYNFFNVMSSYYDGQNRLRTKIKFESAPPTGTYTLSYKLIF